MHKKEPPHYHSTILTKVKYISLKVRSVAVERKCSCVKVFVKSFGILLFWKISYFQKATFLKKWPFLKAIFFEELALLKK